MLKDIHNECTLYPSVKHIELPDHQLWINKTETPTSGETVFLWRLPGKRNNRRCR